MYAASQILILFAYALSVLSSKFENKKILAVVLSMLVYALIGMHYFCLKATTGWVVYVVAALFTLSAEFVSSDRRKTKITISVIFMVATIIACAVFWEGVISLLPTAAILISISTTIFKGKIYPMISLLVQSVILIAYMWLLSSWIGVGLEFVMMACIIMSLIISIKAKKLKKELEQMQTEKKEV